MIAAPDARAIARMMQIETDYLTPQAAELVDVARSLVPKLAARAAEVDANGIVHPESRDPRRRAVPCAAAQTLGRP